MLLPPLLLLSLVGIQPLPLLGSRMEYSSPLSYAVTINLRMDDTVFSSAAFRFVIEAETDILQWNLFVDRWHFSLHNKYRCSSPCCANDPDGCTPSRVVVSCQTCLRFLYPCDFVYVFLKERLLANLGWRCEDVQSFMQEYRGIREGYIAPILRDPHTPLLNHHGEGRWDLSVSIRNMQSLGRLGYEDLSRLERALVSFRRAALQTVLVNSPTVQVASCLKFAHFTLHLEEARATWAHLRNLVVLEEHIEAMAQGTSILQGVHRGALLPQLD
ncbi:hypothetical protein BKA70DRAFT_1223563 [Coprinopsis sp. MPI-PUGE-AT-0042]|nr:hypothetical protein BKA70DRAFT_1223542 [Coprinopsis sp. MPI-PUGE-AT-0042]KAH6907202.1 hypothetical protein BKA70DRAFT_1223563 [Coprinopsis sp. MPI-PUGE-AT-0042]